MLVSFHIFLTIFVLTLELGPVNSVAKTKEASLWSPRCPLERRKIPRLIPNPWNCRSLFICAKGMPIEYYCPEDQIFHPERQECVEKSLHTCKPIIKEWSPFSDCFDDYRKKQYFKHPVDCRKFYHCSPKGPCLKKCPKRTFWDERISNCNWEENVDCKSKYLIPVKPIISSNFMNDEDLDDGCVYNAAAVEGSSLLSILTGETLRS